MRNVALVLASILVFTACKKKEAEPAAAEPAPAPKAQMTVEMPREASAKKLAEQLVANGLQNVNPTGSSDFEMAFVFKGDGNWTADGNAELGGETLECKESGTWKIAQMNEDGKGVVEWSIVRTNCPNRSGGDVQRALVGFEGKQSSISFR